MFLPCHSGRNANNRTALPSDTTREIRVCINAWSGASEKWLDAGRRAKHDVNAQPQTLEYVGFMVHYQLL